MNFWSWWWLLKLSSAFLHPWHFYSQKIIIIKPIVSSKPHWTSANINKPRKVSTLLLNLCPSEEQMWLETASLTSFIQPPWSWFTRTPSTSSTPGCQLHPESLGLSIFSPTCEVRKSHRVTAAIRHSKELCHYRFTTQESRDTDATGTFLMEMT